MATKPRICSVGGDNSGVAGGKQRFVVISPEGRLIWPHSVLRLVFYSRISQHIRRGQMFCHFFDAALLKMKRDVSLVDYPDPLLSQ